MPQKQQFARLFLTFKSNLLVKSVSVSFSFKAAFAMAIQDPGK
jgi:hypothetical protein